MKVLNVQITVFPKVFTYITYVHTLFFRSELHAKPQMGPNSYLLPTSSPVKSATYNRRKNRFPKKRSNKFPISVTQVTRTTPAVSCSRLKNGSRSRLLNEDKSREFCRRYKLAKTPRERHDLRIEYKLKTIEIDCKRISQKIPRWNYFFKITGGKIIIPIP